MDRTELRLALESHSEVLAREAIAVEAPLVEPPATQDELERAEAGLGLPLPPSLRATLETLSGGVRWSWECRFDRDGRPSGGEFPSPFEEIVSGGLEWSIDSLVDAHRNYLDWVRVVYPPDQDDPYGAIWQNKLGLASVADGDVIAVDLDPEYLGSIVYLSHDGGEGHGYRMAHSLADLVDRWVPLGCPGPRDEHWLPFVPYDFGPVDPTCENATRWRSLMGLHAARPRTAPSRADNDLFDSLLRTFLSAPDPRRSRYVALRALTVCDTDRVDGVLTLLRCDDQFVQEAAARRLGAWQWGPAIDDLKDVALTGLHNGRIGAMVALRSMPWDEAKQAREELLKRLGDNWRPYL